MPAILRTQSVNSRLARLLTEVPSKADVALYQVGQELMTRSKALVPVDTGTLKGSGYLTEPAHEGGLTTVQVGYGGPSEAYAVRQHEDLSLSHPGGGQANFLGGPFMGINLVGELAQRINL